MVIGERLQTLRKQKGMSQTELASAISVSRQTVSQWETGQTIPSIDNLYILKDVLDVSFDQLLSDTADNDSQNDTPIEIYRFSYNENDIKTANRIAYESHTKRFIWLTAICAVFLFLYFTSQTNPVSTALLIGLLIPVAIHTIKSIIAFRKTEKNSIAQATQKSCLYEIFLGCICVSVFRNEQLSEKIFVKEDDIRHTFQNHDYFVFIASNRLFIIKKEWLKHDSMLFTMLAPKKAPVSQPKKLSPGAYALSIALFIGSIMSIFAAMVCTVAFYGNSVSHDSMWVFFLFTPIPIASIIFGIIQKRKGYKARKNIIAGIIMLVLLCIYGSFTFIFADDNFHNEDYSAVTRWESEIGIDFPDGGRIYTQDSNLEANNKNGVVYHSFNYVYYDENDVVGFAEDITSDDRWVEIIPPELTGCLPSSFMPFENYCYLLYNCDEKTFNCVPGQSDTYRFALFSYDKADAALFITEYSLDVALSNTGLQPA